jgi:hypothetical protein
MEKLWSMFPSRTFHSFDDIPKGEVPSVFRVVNGDDYNYYESIYNPYDNNDYDIDINKTNDEKDKAMSQIANISSDEPDYESEIAKEKLNALKNKYNADKYNLSALEESKVNESKEIINESLESVKGLIDRMANL